MSKSTIVLVIIFIVAAVGLVVLQNSYFKNHESPALTLFRATPASQIESTLTLIPAFLTAVYGQKASVDIMLDNKNVTPVNQTATIQLEIAYDPAVLSDVQIQPGNFFSNAIVTLNSVNESIGRISYAISVTDETMENKKGTLATITFIPRMQALKNETSLYFLPKSMIKIGDQLNTLQAAYGTKIIFSNKISPPTTQSAIGK